MRRQTNMHMKIVGNCLYKCALPVFECACFLPQMLSQDIWFVKKGGKPLVAIKIQCI